MSANRHRPHVVVLPEDDANRQLAKGFEVALNQSVTRSFTVLPPAGGWTNVLEHFSSNQAARMDLFRHRFMVLLIDFDGREERLNEVKAKIPEHLKERVFILGVLSEPENLKAKLGPYETIGSAMAKDCRDGTDTTWGHDLLRHNAGEIARLRERVRPILFLSPKPVQ
jgi:hypothetical protein